MHEPGALQQIASLLREAQCVNFYQKKDSMLDAITEMGLYPSRLGSPGSRVTGHESWIVTDSNEGQTMNVFHYSCELHAQTSTLISPIDQPHTLSCRMSRLLALPAELRKEIWDFVLAPSNTTRPGVPDESSITIVSRACTSAGFFISKSFHAHAHELDDHICVCHRRPFYICNDGRQPNPALLRTSKQIYKEAMPSLYERRTFSVDPNRRFVSLWDRCAEAWFLLDRFLSSLSEASRRLIHSIRLPMLLSRFEVQGAREAFYSIAWWVPNLHTIEIEFSQSAVRSRWIQPNNNGAQDVVHDLANYLHTDENFFLGPVMAFADVPKIIVTAVDKHDMGGALFERIKPHLEMKIWQQLLPVRVKREQRRIVKIKTALRALEYEECAVPSELDSAAS